MNASAKLRLLIVDDNKAVCGVFAEEARALDQFSEVKTAEDGRQALDTMTAGADGTTWVPEIVITDLYMPNLNGVELLQELNRRGVRPAATVIMSSSSDCAHERAAVRRAGCGDILPKPSSVKSVQELLVSILRVLESRAQATGAVAVPA